MKINRRWWFFGAWLALVGGIIFLADIGKLSVVMDFLKVNPGSDKVCHFGLVGTLAFLFNQALGGRKCGPLMLGSLIVGIVITAEEISQIWVPGRSFDYGDMAANICGCIAADLLARWRLRKAEQK